MSPSNKAKHYKTADIYLRLVYVPGTTQGVTYVNSVSY